MSILIDENTNVLIQGITGTTGRRLSRIMKEYGTSILCGVTPGKKGEEVDGLPVFNTVMEAKENFPELDTTLVSVPAQVVKSSVLEAIDAGIPFIVLRAERVPQQDMMEMVAYARERGSRILGANTIGIISPGKSMVGNLGGRVDLTRQIFCPGPVGIISRSGGQTTTVSYYIRKAGLGQSTVISIGGDPIVGTNLIELLELFQKDDETKLVVIFGEMGTEMEETAARFIKEDGFTKPVIAYIAGRYARREMRFGHAGAIITGSKGNVESKIQALRAVGVQVPFHLHEIGKLAKELLCMG